MFMANRVRFLRYALDAALVLWLVAVVLFLASCGTRLTDAQAAQLSQAKADVEAAALTTDYEARSTLLTAAHNRLLAGLENLDLPAPQTPVEALVEKDGTPVLPAVEREREESRAAAESPPAGLSGLIWGGIGGVGLAALGLLRFSPGTFGLVANLAHNYLAPKATREMRDAQARATEVAEQAIAYGHQVTEAAKAAGLAPTVEVIQADMAKVQDKLGIRPQVQTILKRVKAKRELES